MLARLWGPHVGDSTAGVIRSRTLEAANGFNLLGFLTLNVSQMGQAQTDLNGL